MRKAGGKGVGKAKAAKQAARKAAPKAARSAKRKVVARKPAPKRRAAPPGPRTASAKPPPKRRASPRAAAGASDLPREQRSRDLPSERRSRDLPWESRSPNHRIATIQGGAYMLLSFDRVTWSAEWRPAGGRAERLCFRETLAGAEAACQRHHTTLRADALLLAADAGGLTGKAVTGEAVTWRQGRR